MIRPPHPGWQPALGFRVGATLLTAVTTLVVPTCAVAQSERLLEAEVGAGQQAEDSLLEARLSLIAADEFRGTPVRAVVQLPLRFELLDAAPRDDEIVRSEDWDDPGDFFRIARLLEYGRPHLPLHARFGEVGGLVLGHGTIVNGYNNNVVLGDFSPGAQLAANTAYGGIQTALDDVTAPHLFALRGYVRPWGFGDRESFGQRFSVGVSAASDFGAPAILRECPGCEVGFLSEPAVEERSPVTIAGLDVDLSLVDDGRWRILPYADLNVGLGTGGHAGVSVALLATDSLELALRAEGRLFGGAYIPDYFGPIYEVERFRTTGWAAPIAAPKARVAASRSGTHTGGFGQLSLDWRNVGSLAIAAAEHDGDQDTSAWVRLSVTPPGPIVFGAYVLRVNADPDTLLDLDGLLVVTESRVTLWGPLFLHGRVHRLWTLSVGREYRPATDWSAGAGASFPL